MDKLLFPQPFMYVGSQGPAVQMLQIILLAFECNPLIIPDGVYGQETALGVLNLQIDLGVDQDGDFGPQTRLAFLQKTGINIDIIPLIEGETIVPDEEVVGEVVEVKDDAPAAEEEKVEVDEAATEVKDEDTFVVEEKKVFVTEDDDCC